MWASLNGQRTPGGVLMSIEREGSLKLSIVIPVYNEEGTIGQVIDRVRAVDLGPISKEIIISDDGSSDRTPQVIQEYAKRYRDLCVYTSPINLGKGAALRVGLHLATGNIVIIQDADLELDPAEYPQIIEPIVSGRAQVVYGSRFASRSNRAPLRTRLANGFLTTLTNVLFRARLSDMETAYKAFVREAVSGLRLRCVRFDIEPELTAQLLLAGCKIHEVPIRYDPRTVEEGKTISWVDGIEAIYTLLRCRLEGRPKR
jgi:glycosyltransferase involved in cell wall biosynthesis